MNPSTCVARGLAYCLFTVGLLTTAGIHAREPGAPLGYESQLVSALRELPEEDLKAHFLRCERSATQTSLGSGDAAFCSIGYEILLQRTFGGDFFALLDWWRSQREEDTEIALRSVKSGELK